MLSLWLSIPDLVNDEIGINQITSREIDITAS